MIEAEDGSEDSKVGRTDRYKVAGFRDMSSRISEHVVVFAYRFTVWWRL
jgi:hypothetical protein